MKKSIFAAAAIFFGLVFLSCSDVFGGRETEGIAFTVPPLAPQSASSPARAAAGVSEGPWSIYGFLFGEDADIEQIKHFVNFQYPPAECGRSAEFQGTHPSRVAKGSRHIAFAAALFPADQSEDKVLRMRSRHLYNFRKNGVYRFLRDLARFRREV